MNVTRLLLLSLTVATTAAHGQDLRSCRAVADAAARLACYDGLSLPAGAAAPAAGPTAPLAVSPPAPGVVVSPRAAAVASTALAGEATFGQQGPARGEVAAVRSAVSGRFEGWGPKSRIRLANGQVWEVTDGSSAVVWLLNPQITVRRAALGSFVLEVEGTNRTTRVRRIE